MFILKSSSSYSLRVPIHLSSTVLDQDMARIAVEELAHASNTWLQTYMSTMVTVKVAGMVEANNDDILTIDAPLVRSLPVHTYWVNIIPEPIESLQITWGVMATSTYGDLCPGSRRVGMMLRNLSANEVRLPPRTVVSNVKAAEIVTNLKAPQLYKWGPSFNGTESTIMGWLAYLPNPQKLSWPGQPLYLYSWNQVIPNWNVMCSIRWISQGALNGTPRINKKWEQFYGSLQMSFLKTISI